MTTKFGTIAVIVWFGIALAATRLGAEPAQDQYAVAAGHYARGRWQLAWDEFRVFLAEYPAHPQALAARYYAGEALVQLARWANVVEHFTQFLEDNPPEQFRRKARFRLAEARFFADQRAGARRELEAFVADDQRDRMTVYALGYLGDVELEEGHSAAAESCYRRALAIPGSGASLEALRFGLASACEAQATADVDKHREALRIYRELAASTDGPLAERAALRLANCLATADDHQAAVREYAAFRKRFPKSASLALAQLGEAQSQYQLKQFEPALERLKPLADDEQFSVEARYWIGIVHQAANRPDEALAALQSAAERADASPPHPLHTAIAYRTGEVLLETGHPGDAFEQFQDVVNDGMDGPWAEQAVWGQLRAALAEKDYEQVDANTALFVEHWPAVDRVAAVWQAYLRALLARDQFDDARAVVEFRLSQDAAARDVAIDRYLLALAHLGARQWDDALAALKPVVAQGPADLKPDAQRAQAAALIGQEKFLKACAPLRAYLAAVASRPPSDDVIVARAQLCVCYARTGRFDLARQEWKAVLAAKPTSSVLAAARSSVAEAALAAEDTTWAAELFESLTGAGCAEPVRIRAWWGVARSRLRAGLTADALAALEHVAEQSIDLSLAAEAELLLARSLEQQSNDREALRHFTRLVERHQNEDQLAAGLEAVGRLHDRLGSPDLAIAAYERLQDEFPHRLGRDAVLYNLAWAERAAGDPAAADADFLELTWDYPESRYWPDAIYRLAERALETDHADRAAALLDELLAARPADTILPHALYLRGQAAIAADEWQAARKPLTQLIEQFPDHALLPLAEFWLAESAYRLDDFAAARNGFDTLAARAATTTKEPWQAIVVLRRAQLLAQEKSWTEARELAESIAATFPDFEQQHEVEYLVGRCLAAKADFDGAREAYRRVLDSPTARASETAAMAQWMIGESYFHQRQYERAIREYLRVEILYAYPAWQAAALLQAGKCYEVLGQQTTAIELYTRLLKNFAGTPWADEARRRLATAQEHLERK
ncbi:MAG TPA: tetratricopeptide repeat protein [Pirellulales bacterium]|jgi:TolA-binding protein|nr:tetratricopeptide repeat protein [Pirellulales bacterium]